MAYPRPHVQLVDKRDGRKFTGPAHYAHVFDYIELAPSQRAADTRVTEPAPTTAAATVTEPARTTTSKTKAEEATR